MKGMEYAEVSAELLNSIMAGVRQVAASTSATPLQIVATMGYLTGVYSARAGVVVQIQAPPAKAPYGLEPLAIGYHAEARRIRSQGGVGSA